MKLSDCKSLKDLEEFRKAPRIFYIFEEEILFTKPYETGILFCVEDDNQHFEMWSLMKRDYFKDVFTTEEEAKKSLNDIKKQRLIDRYNNLTAERNKITKNLLDLEKQITEIDNESERLQNA